MLSNYSAAISPCDTPHIKIAATKSPACPKNAQPAKEKGHDFSRAANHTDKATGFSPGPLT